MLFRACAIFLAWGTWVMVVNSGDLHADVDLNDQSFSDSELSSSSFKKDEVKADGPTPEGRSRRLKRGSWSLPPNTSVRYSLDWITPVTALNNTFTLLIYTMIFRFVLPTYTNLQSLYSTLGKIDMEHEHDGENVIDLEFFEEQRANDERRAVYLTIEDIFRKMGYEDGHTCLLRAICELAETPLAHHGLLGKVMDLVFSPRLMKVPKRMENYLNSNRIRRDISSIPELDVLQRPLEDDYTTAYTHGREGKCWVHYYSCPFTVFKIMTPFAG